MDEVRILPGLRWSCLGCGDCCRDYELGPVEPRVVDGLEGTEIVLAWEPAADGWHMERTASDGRKAIFFRRCDGACVFLRHDDSKGEPSSCVVHAGMGSAAKPAFCREFPFTAVRNPDGLFVGIRSHCTGFHESFRSGEPVLPQVPAILALDRLVPLRQWLPELVEVFPGRGVPWEVWRSLETSLQRLLDDGRPEPEPEEAVARLRRGLYRAVSSEPPPVQAEVFEDAFSHLLGRLREAVDDLDDPRDPAWDAWRGARLHRVRAALDRVLSLDVHEAPLAEDARAWLQVVLRQSLMSGEFRVSGPLVCGLGRHLLDVTLARRAVVGDGPGTSLPEITASQLAAELTPWLVVADHPRVRLVLHECRPLLLALFLHR